MAVTTFGDAAPAIESQIESKNIGDEMEKKISPFDVNFAKLVETTLAKWHLPGVALAVVDGDDTFNEVFILQDTVRMIQP